MRTLFIFLLFYTNIYANTSSKELYVTFEMMKGKLEYMDILERKKKKFTQLGLNCYIYKKKKNTSVRCNDTTSTDEYNKNLALLEKLGLRYKVVPLDKKLQETLQKPTLGNGYKAYDAKKYTKAKAIFSKLYTKNKNLENSYALALVAFQEEHFDKVREYLNIYRAKDTKASELFYNSIVKEYKTLLKLNKKSKANSLKKHYIKEYPELKKLWVLMSKYNLKNGYEAYDKKAFKKAYRIFLKLYQREKNFENSYAMGLISLQQKKFKDIRFYLKPYYKTDKKASALYYDSIVNEYYFYTKHKRNREALALQEKYIKIYPKLKTLIKPKLEITLQNGYDLYAKKDYKKAKEMFLKLYNYEKNLETRYALSLIFLQEKKYQRVRDFLNRYRTKDAKSSALIYDSIVAEYYDYTKNGRNAKALELQKKHIKHYPQLKNLIKPKPKYDLKKGYDAYNNKEYDIALFIFSMLYLKENNLDNAYALSSVYFKKSEYDKVRKYLKIYISSSDKASKLFYDSIVSEYYNYTKSARNVRALELKNRYINLYPELQSLVKPTPKYTLKDGYREYDNKQYDKALFIFSKLYRDNNNLENSYAIALLALHNKNYPKVRQYLYYYKKESKKIEQLYYDSILQEYAGYMKRKEYIKAIILLKRFKMQYPQFQKMNEALIIKANLLIKDGDYYKAEKLLRENDFRNTRDLLFEGVYAKAKLLRDKGKELEALKMIVPYVAYYRGASKFYIDISFKRAKEHLQKKNYTQAKNILRPIASVSSDAQEFYYKVIYEENLNAGWNSFHNKNYESALGFFENSCEVSHQYNCIEGIMHSSYKLKDDRKALSSAEEIYQESGSQDSAFIAYDSAYHLKDDIKSDYWYKRLDLKYKKLALFKMDREIQESKMDSMYIALINKYSDDFELALNYLHFLKDLKHFPEFEKFMKNSLYNFELEKEKSLLSQLDREYKNRKFLQYFEKKRYLQCYNYGNKILTKEDDVEYKRMHAWCAFHSQHYNDAERIFENINLLYGRTLEDTDAQFLSAFKDKNYEKATQLLKIVHKYTTDEEKYKEQAEFYISMEQLQEAKKVTLNIEDEEQREELQHKIQKSYKYNRNKINLVAGGFSYNQRSIEDGLHSFTQYSLPIDLDIYHKKYAHYYIDADILYLSDTFEGDNNRNTLTYGLGYNYNEDKTSSNTTFLGNMGIETKYLTLEIGSTPLGADTVPKLMGFASLHGGFSNLNIDLKLIRKRADDSMLSSVGEILEAKGRDIKWGRVFRSGAEIDISYSSDISYSLSLASYPSIEGHHVKQNSEIKTVGIISYSPISDNFSYIDYSFIAVYDKYDFNSDLFTYGHGGYFSPQKFILGSFAIDIADNVTDDIYWKLKASLGYETFSVDDVEQYPVLDANSKGLYGEVEGYDESGITFKIGLASSYSFSKQLDMIGAFSYEQMSTFQDITAGFSLIYSFDKKHKVNLYNIHDGHRVEF